MRGSGIRARPLAAFSRRGVLAAAALLAAPRIARAATPLRIGVLTDMSSWGRDTGGPGAVIAAKMAAEEMGGAIGGRPIEILTGDHQMQPMIGIQIGRQWIDTEGVLAIADVPNSALGIAISGLAREKDRVALISGAGSSAITGKLCNDRTVQFTYDTYALAKVVTGALIGQGAKSWFFITADYAFGHQLQEDATAFITAAGGRVVGQALHPPGTTDFSAQLLAAQASKADVVALANAAGDADNTLKQSAEFGIGATRNGQHVAALLMFLSDVHAVGLPAAQGAVMATASYWDMNPRTRAWSAAFFKRAGVMPNMEQTGTYGAVLHYLKAVRAAGTDAAATMAAMRAAPIEDVFVHDGHLRADGRVIRAMYLAQVKTPAQSRGPWDYLNILRTVSGEDAFRPAADSACPLLHKA
jgi:branched-chain amino acid transport system substrate-binding protein